MGSILGILFHRQVDPPEFQSQYNIPLPEQMHKSIPDETVNGRRVLVIGDVHGCLDELQELLRQTNTTPENTLIVFCGDVVNKGPKNIETLRFVRQLGSLAVKGNHEEHVIKEWFRYKNNGLDGLRNKYHWVQDMTQEEVDYLISLPFTISIPCCNAIVVHAGLVPGVPLNYQQPKDMTLMRNLIEKDNLQLEPTKVIENGLAWASYWEGPQHVYYGHDARRKLQKRNFSTGLDTGCLYGGHLSAAFANGDRTIVSVKAKNMYQKP